MAYPTIGRDRKMSKPETIADLKTVLSEKLGFTKDSINIDYYFEFTDHHSDTPSEPDFLIAKIKAYVDSDTFRITAQLVKEWGGQYFPKPAQEFRIPKINTTSIQPPETRNNQELIAKPEKPQTSTSQQDITSTPVEARSIEEKPKEILTEESESSYLRQTYEKIGQLLPVLKAPDGEIIDGKHRLRVVPDWRTQVIPGLDNPVKKAMARLMILFD